MYTNFLFILIGSFAISLSIIGYGYFFQKIILKNKLDLNIGYLGLFGIFFLIIYSYLSNLFIEHSKVHNFVLIFVGFSIFVFNRFNNFRKNSLKFYILNFIILFIALLIFKNHDDFSYYHFPYTYLLTQHELIIGIGNFGHGFRTQSSLFYLNSLFYLPYFKYYLFNLGSFLIFLFSNIILLDYLFGKSLTNNIKFNKNFYKYLSLLSLIFINIFFYRLAEHGTDRSAQILIFILFLELIFFLNINKLNKNNLTKIYIICGLIISFKAFYILYLIIFIPLFFSVLQKTNFKKTLNYFLLNKSLFYFILVIGLVLITNFFNSGCLIYPLHFTCFDYLSWSIPIEEVKLMNDWYELWSKSGASPEYRVINKEEYIQNFNWVSNWFSMYFFTKVSDLILGLALLSLIVFFMYYSNKTKLFIQIKYLNFVFVILFLLSFEWFFNHPALRYGGFVLIALFFFIPLSKLMSTSFLSQKDFVKKSIILILITVCIFVTRNITRLNKEFNVYNYNPLIHPFYSITDKDLRIEKKLKELINDDIKCKNNDKDLICLEKKKLISKKFNKIIINNK